MNIGKLAGGVTQVTRELYRKLCVQRTLSEAEAECLLGDQEALIVFAGDNQCEIRTRHQTLRIVLPEPDWEQGQEQLARFNQSLTLMGKPIATVLEIDGFHPWWFAQNHCLRWVILPVARYRLLLEKVAGYRVLRVFNPPRDFSRLAVLLKRMEVECVWPGQRTGGVWWTIQNTAGYLLKAGVSLFGILSCLLRPGKVLLYSPAALSPVTGCDPRLADIYAELRRRRIPFMELVFSGKNSRAFSEQRVRRRLCIFWFQIESLFLRALPKIPRPTLTQEPEDPLTAAMYDEFWDRAVLQLRRTQMAKALFRVLRPDVVLAMDDARHAFPLFAAAKSLGIRSVGFQHGAAASGLMALCLRTLGLSYEVRSHWPDKYFVFGDYFRYRYLEVSNLLSPDQVVAAGPMKRVPWRDSKRLVSDSVIRVLFVGEHSLYLHQLHGFVASLLKEEALDVWYRPEPDGADGAVMAAVRTWFPGIKITNKASFVEDVVDFDVCVGGSTTALIECYQVLVPSVVVLGLTPYPQDSVIVEPWSLVARTPQELKNRIVEAAQLPLETLREVRGEIWGNVEAGYVAVVNAVEEALAAFSGAGGKSTSAHR